ncbi:Arrestin domain-containing protein 5 [Folsomia candida]|uniref:Arrestin domain-containing protein 5 n=1 Tax=Folsomia candida TaxID=158441 RepID=A0A226DEH7_FOLCA|nr:Arrestin domain-containing protein 5 [Folsomia candida]
MASEETLREGTHIFPFEYQLPPNLPSSLATPTITIWYKMEALIHKEPKPRREILLFPVRGDLDLNEVTEDDLTVSRSEVRSRSLLTFYLPCLCSLNYASIGLCLSKRGFVPGEKVELRLAVLTDTCFTFVVLMLMQEITVVTKEKTMIERRTVVKLALDDLAPDEDNPDDYKRWVEEIEIPEESVVSSNAKEYGDIKINYFIQFSAEAIKFPYQLIKIVVPITLGSVELIKKIDDDEDTEVNKGQTSDDSNPGSGSDEIDKIETTESVEIVEKVEPDDPIISTIPPILNQPAPPPKIIIVQLEPEPGESQNNPVQDVSFLNSLESSMIHVVPKKSPLPQKSTLRRLSATDSTGSGSGSPVKKLVFQEVSPTKFKSPGSPSGRKVVPEVGTCSVNAFTRGTTSV